MSGLLKYKVKLQGYITRREDKHECNMNGV